MMYELIVRLHETDTPPMSMLFRIKYQALVTLNRYLVLNDQEHLKVDPQTATLPIEINSKVMSLTVRTRTVKAAYTIPKGLLDIEEMQQLNLKAERELRRSMQIKYKDIRKDIITTNAQVYEWQDIRALSIDELIVKINI